MSVPEGHDAAELGAHALGLLDATQARMVEQHLTWCEPCRREWEGLRQMADLLTEMPPEAFLDGPPDGDLVLARTLRQVRGEAAGRRRRRVLGVAAAAMIVVAIAVGGGVAFGRATAPPTTVTQAAGTVTIDGAKGAATMRAAVSPAADWVRVAVTVTGVPRGTHCRLVVVRKDGTQEVAGSWTVGARAETGGISVDGSADIPLADVAAVSVQDSASGEEYVTAVT